MFINNNIDSITCYCICISHCDHYWRNGICNGVWRCDCGDISCIIHNKVNIKKIKAKGLREIVGSFLFRCAL